MPRFATALAHLAALARLAALAHLAALAAPAAAARLTPLHGFAGGADGADPEAGLILGPDGTVYGTTDRGGRNDAGTVFALTPPVPPATGWRHRVLYRFPGGSGGGYPLGLVRAPDGTLYGVTLDGGSAGFGIAFALIPGNPWRFSTLHDFTGGSDGAYPERLWRAADGTLYGSTAQGGTGQCRSAFGDVVGCGVAYALTPSAAGWVERVIHRFKGALDGADPDGADPDGGLAADADGRLYGTTSQGGPGRCRGNLGTVVGCGTVFRLAPSVAGWSEAVLYGFRGGAGDGQTPLGRLVVAGDTLYGVTAEGGSTANQGYGWGTVFRLAQAAGIWRETLLYRLSRADGFSPQGSLARDAAGRLYGSAELGGPGGAGTLFELSPPGAAGLAWTYRRLVGFSGANGVYPLGDLVLDATGALYGTTYQGGGSNDGTAYRLVP